MRPQIQLSMAMPKIMASVSDPDWKIQCNVGQDSVDIWLHGIVGDEMTNTDSSSIGRILAQNRGKSLTMFVNSPGGLAYDGVAIFNAIQQHRGPTTGVIEGLAGSAASLAIMACDTIKSHENAKFHPHYSLCVAMGHKDDIKDTLLMMEKLDADLEMIYAARTGQPMEQIKQHLIGPHGDGTHFTAAEARSFGYVDEIIPLKAKPHASRSARAEMEARFRFLAQRVEFERRRV